MLEVEHDEIRVECPRSRRGSRIAHRTRGDLFVVHVVTGDEEPGREWSDTMRRLVEDLGGEFAVLQADDAVDAVLSYAYQHRVTQIVVGESLRARWQEMFEWVVRQPADPQGVERRHPRHGRQGAVTARPSLP